MKFKLVTILAALLLGATSFVFSQDVATDADKTAKDAGHDTKVAAQKTGHERKRLQTKLETRPRLRPRKLGTQPRQVQPTPAREPIRLAAKLRMRRRSSVTTPR